MRQGKTFNYNRNGLLFIINYVECIIKHMTINVILFIMMMFPASSFATGEGYLGIRTGLSQYEDGLIVEAVEPGSTADHVGLRPGDVIKQLNDITIFYDSMGFWQYIHTNPGANIRLLVSRQGYLLTRDVRLGHVGQPNQAQTSTQPQQPAVINNYNYYGEVSSRTNQTIQSGTGNESRQQNQQ